MGGGKERKMNGGSSSTNQVKDEVKMLKQKFFQTKSTKKNIFFQKRSPLNVTLNI
jgi:hypothetical protein